MRRGSLTSEQDQILAPHGEHVTILVEHDADAPVSPRTPRQSARLPIVLRRALEAIDAHGDSVAARPSRFVLLPGWVTSRPRFHRQFAAPSRTSQLLPDSLPPQWEMANRFHWSGWGPT